MVELPEFMRFDVVIIVVDFKITHFILTHTMITTEGVARLILHYI